MSKQLIRTSSNGTMTREEYYVGRITTSGSTTIVAETVAIPQNKLFSILITVLIYRADFTNSNSGTVQAAFLRAAGNVSRDGAQIKNMQGGLSGASLDMVANTSTQTCDIQINGVAATSINWDIAINLYYNI